MLRKDQNRPTFKQLTSKGFLKPKIKSKKIVLSE